MTRNFENLRLPDVVSVADADDAQAMDDNARIAGDLYRAYEYANSNFGGYLAQLRRHWTGPAAGRFLEEADVVHEDVGNMGEVLNAHSQALPEVAGAMRTLRQESHALLEEYREKRGEISPDAADATPQRRQLAEEYSRKARDVLAAANDVYHQYNNGWLSPPPEFRGVLPDSAGPRATSTSELPVDTTQQTAHVASTSADARLPPANGPELQSVTGSATTTPPPPTQTVPSGLGAGGATPGFSPAAPLPPPRFPAGGVQGPLPGGAASRPFAGRTPGAPSPGALRSG
ncbi:MAG: hypothetical protein ACRDXX_12225, partial [Stackebrandtia sp.]